LLASTLVSKLCSGTSLARRLVTDTCPGSAYNSTSCLFVLGEVWVVIVIATICAVSFNWGWNNDSLGQVSLWLESHGISSIFNNLNFPIGIDVSILSLDGSINKPCLQLECTISCFISVCIGTIFIMLIDLLEDRHDCSCFCPLCCWLAPSIGCLSTSWRLSGRFSSYRGPATL